MIQQQIISGLAALAVVTYLWLRLDAVDAQLDACRESNRVAEQINSMTTAQLADASRLLAEQTRQIEVNAQALADAMAQRERAQMERNLAWEKNSDLVKEMYAGSCATWATTPVCAEAVEQWRAEYQQYQQSQQ